MVMSISVALEAVVASQHRENTRSHARLYHHPRNISLKLGGMVVVRYDNQSNHLPEKSQQPIIDGLEKAGHDNWRDEENRAVVGCFALCRGSQWMLNRTMRLFPGRLTSGKRGAFPTNGARQKALLSLLRCSDIVSKSRQLGS